MDALHLAEMMIEYEKLYRRMQEIETEIAPFILETGETQKIGNVTAKYLAGRTVYDYETAGQAAPPALIADHTEIIKKVDWRSVCKEAKIEAPVKVEPVPSVKMSVG